MLKMLLCRAGCFRLVPDGAAFERNLYWCETGPVIFRRGNTAIYGSQAFPEGFKAEASRFALLEGVQTLTRFVNQSGLAGFIAHPKAGDWAWWQGQGHDSEGVVADPMFVDLPKGDFRMRPDSPALKMGLVSFDRHPKNDGTVSVCGIDFSQRNVQNGN